MPRALYKFIFTSSIPPQPGTHFYCVILSFPYIVQLPVLPSRFWSYFPSLPFTLFQRVLLITLTAFCIFQFFINLFLSYWRFRLLLSQFTTFISAICWFLCWACRFFCWFPLCSFCFLLLAWLWFKERLLFFEYLCRAGYTTAWIFCSCPEVDWFSQFTSSVAHSRWPLSGLLPIFADFLVPLSCQISIITISVFYFSAPPLLSCCCWSISPILPAHTSIMLSHFRLYASLFWIIIDPSVHPSTTFSHFCTSPPAYWSSHSAPTWASPYLLSSGFRHLTFAFYFWLSLWTHRFWADTHSWGHWAHKLCILLAF